MDDKYDKWDDGVEAAAWRACQARLAKFRNGLIGPIEDGNPDEIWSHLDIPELVEVDKVRSDPHEEFYMTVDGRWHPVLDLLLRGHPSETPEYSVDGGMFRHGHLPYEEENVYGFCGLCITNRQ